MKPSAALRIALAESGWFAPKASETLADGLASCVLRRLEAEGFVIVPRVPSSSMLRAANDAQPILNSYWDFGRDIVEGLWTAMVEEGERDQS